MSVLPVSLSSIFRGSRVLAMRAGITIRLVEAKVGARLAGGMRILLDFQNASV